MSLIIVLRNISALAPVSDYRYAVMVGDGSEAGSTTIETGLVTGHQRSDGWVALVQSLIEDRLPDARLTTRPEEG